MKQYSIILPVRNGMPELKSAVKSVLNQTYKDFDLLVLDNNSSDDSVEWLRQNNDPRIKIFKSDISLSIEESWSRILDIKKREYMVLFAHDDVLLPNFLKEIDLLISENPDCSLFQTSGELIDSQGKTIRKVNKIKAIETVNDYLIARYSGERDVYGSGYVFKSDDYDRVGGIPKFHKLCFADDALWMMLMNGSAKASSSESLVQIRIHGNSESATNPENWTVFLNSITDFSEFLEDYDARYNSKYNAEILVLKERFFRDYLSNILILAIVHFSEKGIRIPVKEYELITKTYYSIMGPGAKDLRLNHKVFLVYIIHLIFPKLVPLLWKTYNFFRNK